MKLIWWLVGACVAYLTYDAVGPGAADAPEALTQPAARSGAADIKRIVQPRIDQARLQSKLARVRTSLYMYNAETDKIPEGLDEVVQAGYLKRSEIEDPWGNRFSFRREKKQSAMAFVEEYELFVWSKGPDGTGNSPDDIYLP